MRRRAEAARGARDGLREQLRAGQLEGAVRSFQLLIDDVARELVEERRQQLVGRGQRLRHMRSAANFHRDPEHKGFTKFVNIFKEQLFFVEIMASLH